MSSSERRLAGVLWGICVLGATPGAASAATDLAALQVLPQRGQSADQTRRDRYECHNWAVEQTGVVPRATTAQPAATDHGDEASRKAERANRAVGGAVIGAAIGSFIGATQGRYPGDAALAGAAVGAAVGAATAHGDDDRSKAPGGQSGRSDQADSDYLRALSACMEGRGYKLVLPGGASETEDASST